VIGARTVMRLGSTVVQDTTLGAGNTLHPYCVIGGEAERIAAFGAIQKIRASGYRVDYPMKDVAFGKQLKAASDSGAKLALIFGADELAKGVVKILFRTTYGLPCN
jgi:histidyl-tRNA synthetase